MLAENTGTAAARKARSYSSCFRLAMHWCSSSRTYCWLNSTASFKTAQQDLETYTAKVQAVVIVDGWSITRWWQGEETQVMRI